MKSRKPHKYRPALVLGATVAALGLGGTAWAYWTDAGTVFTTGVVSTATSVPTPTLSCPTPAVGANHVATWGMPDGYHADFYQVTMDYDTPGHWQGTAGGAGIWGVDGNTNGHWVWPTYAGTPPGLTTSTSGSWGIIEPSTLIGTQDNTGTLSVVAIIGGTVTTDAAGNSTITGGWRSAAATATWEIKYTGVCALVCMVSTSVNCTVTNHG